MEITITLTAERYDALTKTAELHLPDGTPEEYLQGVIDSACDSYVRTYPEVSLEVYKQRAEAAEAKAAQEAQKAAEAQAKAAALESEKVAGASLAEQIEAL